MKKLIMKSFGILSLMALSLSLMSLTEEGSRRPFWGTVSSNCVTEYVGGGCTQQYCDYDSYVFWINVEHLEHIPTGEMNCP